MACEIVRLVVPLFHSSKPSNEHLYDGSRIGSRNGVGVTTRSSFFITSREHFEFFLRNYKEGKP